MANAAAPYKDFKFTDIPVDGSTTEKKAIDTNLLSLATTYIKIDNGKIYLEYEKTAMPPVVPAATARIELQANLANFKKIPA